MAKDGYFHAKQPKRNHFFVHVNVISELFKKKFLDYLKKSNYSDKLKYVGKIVHLGKDSEFKKLCDNLYSKKWITYIKRPFGGPKQVLEYLGRYTHRVAISNERILEVKNGKVIFRYRDYGDGNKNKLLELKVFEFIRRFLLHVLPCKYYKIRYYGIFSNRNRKKKIKISKELLGVTEEKEEPVKPQSWEDLLFKLTGEDPRICPSCKKGRMVRKYELSPVINPPPKEQVIA